MSDDNTVTLSTQGLDKLLKALKAKPPRARVGILGGKTQRGVWGTHEASTNAEIGAAHEFGSPARGLPQRSFLRVPISDNLQKEMEQSGALDKDTLTEVIKTGSVLSWVKKIAILSEGIVADAFATGGFGKWAPWQTKNYSNNANMLLVDTTQLRESITSEVKE